MGFAPSANLFFPNCLFVVNWIPEYKTRSKSCRYLQQYYFAGIVCAVAIMYIMCMQLALHIPKNPCTILIPLCKNNLNLPICLSFFQPRFFSLDCLLHSFIILSCSLLCCAALFVCFYRSRFCSPATNQKCLSVSKAWFPFILLCRSEKYHVTGLLGLHINYTNQHELTLQRSGGLQRPPFFWRRISQ